MVKILEDHVWEFINKLWAEKNIYRLKPKEQEKVVDQITKILEKFERID